MGILDKLNLEALLANQQKCPWLIIITQLMDYDIPIDCKHEKRVKKWLREQIESERDLDSGLL